MATKKKYNGYMVM